MGNAIAAEVIAVLGRMGVKGVSRVRCRIKDDRGKDKTLMRNVVGPVRIGDTLMLKETEMDVGGRFS